MRLVNFYYTLDKTFKEGLDHRACREERDKGNNVDSLYYPHKTGIYLSWNLNNKYYKEAVGQKVRPCEWDFSVRLPSKKCQSNRELSVMLKSILSRLEREYLNIRTNEIAITPLGIRELVRGVINGPVEDPSEKKGLFWRVFEEFLAEKAQLTKPSTVVKYKSLQKTLLAFEKAMNYPLSFESINARWYNQFMIYSTGREVAHMNGTIAKNVRMVKAIMNYAYDLKYTRSLEFKRFKCDDDITDPIHLAQEELALMESYDASYNCVLALTKSIFLTGCYTGARISDLMGMKKRNLKVSKDGMMEWENFQVKGRKVKAVKIFIVKPARRILDKYLIDKTEDDFVFPRISPVTVNKKLKTLGQLAGISTPVTKVNYSGKNRIEETLPKYKYLTTHIGRKTFISLLCAENMPDHEIMAMSGHSSSKEMRMYKGVNRKQVVDGMKRVFEQNEFVTA